MSAGTTLKGIDPRYGLIRVMLDAGRLPSFMEIFRYIPKTVVANDMGIRLTAFNEMLRHPEKFTLTRILTFAHLFDIDEDSMLDLVVQYYLQLKKSKVSGDELH